VPLQKENERLVKENNDLHFQIISRKEEADSTDLKWRAVVSRNSNELQDLQFLNEQYVASVKKFETENAKLRRKLDSVMEKLYLPSQDQIVGGLTAQG